MRKHWTGLVAGAALALAFSVPAKAQELTILWAEWPPADYLQELVNEYTAETGVVVTVEATPWGDFQTKAFAEFNANGDAYDMVVGDSQWLGAASQGGHYVDLTDWIVEHGVDKNFVPATLQYYAQYGGKYWSIPAEGDANGWAYRKDWFEDPTEMANFKAKYGYDLGVPQDFQQLIDIAEFFTRPEENRYGVALYTQTAYDAMAMGLEQTIFTYGGDLGDYTTGQVDGILNSDKNVEALKAYRQLYTYTPPNWTQAFFIENNQAFTEGLVAMSMNYF
ncbi:MAG: extracellular solute-binding protein, partial [Bauldia sp.]